jgi:hypothetical protein
MNSPPRCAICQHPGEEFCSDWLECNYRARRRLGMPVKACEEWRQRDRERMRQERVLLDRAAEPVAS